MKKLGLVILLVGCLSPTNSSTEFNSNDNFLKHLKLDRIKHSQEVAKKLNYRTYTGHNDVSEKVSITSDEKGNPIALQELPLRKAGTDSSITKAKSLREKNIQYAAREYLFRRAAAVHPDDTSSSSSSREMKPWKEEFKNMWLHKKFEALNETVPRGDHINMVAARPWDVPCGDPNQHDMPWGTCTLSMECEPELRVYRGDLHCGESRLVCCAIKANDYDLYQGFDVSFNDKSLSTDLSERNDKTINSDERRKKRIANDRKKRKKSREARKKKIKRDIKKIVKEITKILNKQSRNSTNLRKKRVKQLKSFLKYLKKQYRKDRDALQNLDEKMILTIDKNLMTKLNQIMKMNLNFANNHTFREIIVNGTMTKQGARMLLQAYPDLAEYMKQTAKSQRRTMDGGGDPNLKEYDIEYGYLYY